MKGDSEKNKKKQEEMKKQSFSEKYYDIKADFTYLKNYNYHITRELGRGGYGVVYKAHHITDPEKEFAIKINFNTITRELLYTEMAFLQLVKGYSNLPRLYNLFVHDDITHIVIQYFEFKPFISFFNTFQMEEVKRYLYEMLKALKNLKDLGIYHRDVKPANFLYNPETHVGILIDFGLAEIDPGHEKRLKTKVEKLKGEGKDAAGDIANLKIYKRLAECIKLIGKNKLGTEAYMPLESVLRYRHQDYQSDIWPVGVSFLQFVCRKYGIFSNITLVEKPDNVENSYFISFIMQLANFFGKEVIDQCKVFGYELKLPTQLVNKKLDFKEIVRIDNFDDNASDLLWKLLQLDPKKRITAEEALVHPFFDSILTEKVPIEEGVGNVEKEAEQRKEVKKAKETKKNKDVEEVKDVVEAKKVKETKGVKQVKGKEVKEIKERKQRKKKQK